MYLNDLSGIFEEIELTADKAYYAYRSGTKEEAMAKATREFAGWLKEAVNNRISKQKSNSIPKILKT